MSASRQYIILAEGWLDIATDGASNHIITPQGRLLQAAAHLARAGNRVSFLAEIGSDHIGNIVAQYLTDAGVDLSQADRHAGKTSVTVTINGETSRYDMTTDGEGLDIGWPRIDNGDVVIFGGYAAIDQRIRQQLVSFLENAHDRGATIIYVPEISDSRISRITKVMPVVYENLETADAVITLPGDLQTLYGHEDPERAQRESLSYYVDRCDNAASVDELCRLLTAYK